MVLIFCLLVLMTVPSFLGRSDLFYFLCAVTFISLPLCSVCFIFSVSLKLSKLFTCGKLLRALMSLFPLRTLFVSSPSYLRRGDQGWLQNPKWWHNTNLRNSIIVFSKVFPLDPRIRVRCWAAPANPCVSVLWVGCHELTTHWEMEAAQIVSLFLVMEKANYKILVKVFGFLKVKRGICGEGSSYLVCSKLEGFHKMGMADMGRKYSLFCGF